MTRTAVSIAGLAAVYLAALGRAGAWDAAAGLAFAGAAWWSVRRHVVAQAPDRAGPHALSRLAWLGPFLAVLIARGVRESVRFLRYVRRPGDLTSSGFVRIPFGDRTEVGVAVTGLCVSLTPGAVLVGVDEPERTMIFQLADARGAAAFRRDQDEFYRRWQRRVAP